MPKLIPYDDEIDEEEFPSSFIPDAVEEEKPKLGLLSKIFGKKQEEEPEIPKSFVADKPDVFKEAPDALKVANPDVDRLVADTKKALSGYTDFSNPPLEEQNKNELPVRKPKGFLQGVKDIGEDLYNTVSKTGKSASEHLKRGEYGEAFHDIAAPVTDPLTGISSAAANLLHGKRPIEDINSSDAKNEVQNQLLGLTGIPGERIKEAWSDKDYPRLAGQGLSAAALVALTHKLGKSFGPKETELISSRPEELPIRREMRNITPELPPDLVPVGEENIFNSIREKRAIKSPEEITYENVKSKFGGREGIERDERGIPLPYGEKPETFIPHEQENPLADYKPEERQILKADASKMTPDQLRDLNAFIDSVPDVDHADLQNQLRESRTLKFPEETQRFPADEAIDLGEIHPVSEELPVRPTAKHIGTQEAFAEFPAEQLYNIEGGPKDKSTVTAATLREMGIDIPENNPELAGKSGTQLREEALASRRNAEAVIPEEKKFVNPFEKPKEEIPQSFVPDEIDHNERINAQDKAVMIAQSNNKSGNMSRKELMKMTENSIGKADPKIIQDIQENGIKPVQLRLKRNSIDNPKNIDIYGDNYGTSGEFTIDDEGHRILAAAKDLGINDIPVKIVGNIRESINPEATTPYTRMYDRTTGKLNKTEQPQSFQPDEIVEMQGGLGGFSPRSKKKVPFEGRYAVALDALFNAMGSISENRVQQDQINRAERAKRFASFASVGEEGKKGARLSLSKLAGDYEKVEGDALKMGRKESDALFTAVKQANITVPEKARGYTALFKILNGETPQRNELRLLDDVFGNGFAERVVEMHGGLGAVGMKVGKVANTMKAMASSLDLSAPFRQGIGLVHREEFRNAFKEMFKYLAKPEYYDAAMQAIEERPDYLLGRESGLFLAKSGKLLSGEEAFMNNYTHNIPKFTGIPTLVDASERAYTGFLNKLRADTFDNLIKNAKAMGHEVSISDSSGAEVPTKIAENIAKYINTSTGRGGLGRLEKMAPELNTILWSPRLISSRLSILNPKYYMDMDSFTRKEAIKSLFAIAATGTAVTGLGKLAGAKVSTDPTSSDFMKARFGNNVLDPFAGFQQPIVAAMRLIEGPTKNKPFQTRTNVAENFAANKLSPMAALAYEIGSAKKWTGGGDYVSKYGTKKNIRPEIANGFVPMFIQDATEVFQSDPSFAEQVGLDTASLFGMGVQSYPEPKSDKKSVFKNLKAQ